MMEWTDRHCRMFHRTLSRRAQLYTEMVTAAAIVHGPATRLLAHDPAENPLVLQLGGSEPGLLAQATRIAAGEGYGEVNLNVGCPSDRVQSGCFGAALMRRPALVGDCVAAMAAAAPVEVTVKCRIGVDDQVPEEVLPAFLETIRAAGVTKVTIHARKAWLQGLSPKENREIPPLDYDLVRAMREAFPDLRISINGGIATLGAVQELLAEGFEGVMVGRAAYHDPWEILGTADPVIWGAPAACADRHAAVEAMRPYIARHLAQGGRLHQITRHMLGLFAGQPGARHWRRVLSEGATRPGAGLDLIDAALSGMQAAA